MARLLYGGRNSLLIGVGLGAPLLRARRAPRHDRRLLRRHRRLVIAARLLDVVWAFPVYLLAICLSVVLLTSGLVLGPIHIGAGQPAAADR